jgi:hypothetical protein
MSVVSLPRIFACPPDRDGDWFADDVTVLARHAPKCSQARAWFPLGMPNIYKPDFEPGERPEGFRVRCARIGYALGSELLGCSLFEMPAGETAYPWRRGADR